MIIGAIGHYNKGERPFELLRGCSGDVKEALAWLNGSLVDSGENCYAHDHECSH